MGKKVKSIRMDELGLETLQEICVIASKMFGSRISMNYLLERFIADGMSGYCERLEYMANNEEWASKYLKGMSLPELRERLRELSSRSEGYSSSLDEEIGKESE